MKVLSFKYFHPDQKKDTDMAIQYDNKAKATQSKNCSVATYETRIQNRICILNIQYYYLHFFLSKTKHE